MTKQIFRIIFLVVLVIFAGCARNELLSDISQQQSIEVMAVLRKAGITAQRIKSGQGKRASFIITVRPAEYQSALAVLHEFGLPRDSEQTVEELTKQQGFVPNSMELDRVRRDRAMAVDVERLISGLPDVVDVRAVIRSHVSGSFLKADDSASTKASVIVRFVSSSGIPAFSEAEVKEIVVNSVPDITKEQVKVTLSHVIIDDMGFTSGDSALVSIEPFSFYVPQEQKGTAQWQLLLVILLFCACAGLLGIYFGWSISRKRPTPVRQSASISLQAELEPGNIYIGQNKDTRSSKLTTMPAPRDS